MSRREESVEAKLEMWRRPVAIPALLIAMVVSTAAALAPAWWWTVAEVRVGGEAAWLMLMASSVALVSAIVAIACWTLQRRKLAGFALVLVGIAAPTGFAYVGNLLCIILGLYIAIREVVPGRPSE